MRAPSFKKIKETLQDTVEPRNMRAIVTVFWRMLILSACVLSLASIFFGVWMFQSNLESLEQAQQPPAAVKAPFDKNAFTAVVSAFSDRQLQYQVIEAAPAAIADPSK